MINTAYSRSKRIHGFSLVEIMVALVIGMIAMIVVLQIFSASEGNKRTTTGADDAQMSGAVALFGLQRDIRQSGYGIGALNLMGCSIQLRSGITLSALAPVIINSSSVAAGDPNTDTLLIVYGNSNGTTDGELIDNHTQGQTVYTMRALSAAQPDDLVIAEATTPSSPCQLILDKVASVSGTTTSNVTVNSGDANVTGGVLYNLGKMPKVLAYAVRGGNLTVCDYMVNNCGSSTATNWLPIAGNIASVRAEYGRDTSSPNMDGIVDTYDQTAPTSACEWVRIPAIRLVIVARNSQYDKSVVTASAPTWEDSNDNNAAPIDLSANTGLPTGTTWHNYRYKVYQSVVPLRNVTWMGVPTGC